MYFELLSCHGTTSNHSKSRIGLPLVLQQESHRVYGTADEVLSTTLVMFKKMFLF